MGPTRFPYGQALGFTNQFNYRGTTAGNITGTATPNVTEGSLFYANNTDVLTITNFILSDTANRQAEYEGKLINVFFIDTATRIANTAPLVLQGTDNLAVGTASAGASFFTLMQSRGSWYEVDRAQPNRSEVTTFVTNAQSSLNIDGVRVVRLNNTGATTNTIIAFSGGQVGQELTVMQVGSNATRFIEGGNIFIGLTNAMLINASGAYKFIKFDNTNWRVLAISSGGSI